MLKLDKEKEIKTDGVCTLRSSEGERVCAVLLNRKAGTFIDKPSAYFFYLFIFFNAVSTMGRSGWTRKLMKVVWRILRITPKHTRKRKLWHPAIFHKICNVQLSQIPRNNRNLTCYPAFFLLANLKCFCNNICHRPVFLVILNPCKDVNAKRVFILQIKLPLFLTESIRENSILKCSFSLAIVA